MTGYRDAALLLTLLLLAPGVIAAEALEDTFIAAELQRTAEAPDVVAQVAIAAPVDFVFGFLTRQPHRYTADAATVSFDHTASAAPGQLGPGSERVIGLRSGETLVQRFLLVDDPHSYAYFTDMSRSTLSAPLRYSVTRYTLAATGPAESRLQVALVYQPSSRLLAFFVRRAFQAALQRDFERAAQLIAAQWQLQHSPVDSQPR